MKMDKQILTPAERVVNGLAAERAKFRETLIYLVDLHHRTLTGSKLHDPENLDWTDCPCKSCRRVKEVLEECS